MLVLSMLNWKDISSSWVKYLKIVLLQVRIQISSFWGIHGDSFEATFQVKMLTFLLFWCWKYVNVKKCFLLLKTICNCLTVLQKYYALNSNLFENLWAFPSKSYFVCLPNNLINFKTYVYQNLTLLNFISSIIN